MFSLEYNIMNLRKEKKTLIFGHRGLFVNAKENTMAAFHAAIDNGADGIELDVQLTKDNKMVIIHDDNAKRTSGVDLIIKDSTYEEVMAADSSIPTLEELLSTFKDTIYYDIEIKENSRKYTPLAKMVFDLIKQYKLEDNCMVSSFNPFSIIRFNKVNKRRILTSIIYDMEEELAPILRKGFLRHFIHVDILKPGTIIAEKQVGKINKDMSVWTVNEVELAEKYKSLGAKIIITNRCDIIK